MGVKWKEQDLFLKNGGQIYATLVRGLIAISVREISLVLQTAICYAIPGKRHWGVGYKMLNKEEEDKERILTALESKPLLTEELLEALGYEPGGGELVFPIRELIEEGKIMREKVRLRIWWGLVPGVDTFRYRRC